MSKITWWDIVILLTKTVVQPHKNDSFMVNAVNLSFRNVAIFKNQKIGKLSEIVDVLDSVNGCQVSSILIEDDFFARGLDCHKSN